MFPLLFHLTLLETCKPPWLPYLKKWYLFGQVPGFAAQIITCNIYKYRPGFNFIFATVKSRRMRWVGHVARMGEESVQCFVGKPEGKRPLRRQRCRWEDEIRMDLREIGWGCRTDSVGSR
jgi:hypothetical protein